MLSNDRRCRPPVKAKKLGPGRHRRAPSTWGLWFHLAHLLDRGPHEHRNYTRFGGAFKTGSRSFPRLARPVPGLERLSRMPTRLCVFRTRLRQPPVGDQFGRAVVLVSWISQTFLQLVLLSVVIVGQNVLAAAADKEFRSYVQRRRCDPPRSSEDPGAPPGAGPGAGTAYRQRVKGMTSLGRPLRCPAGGGRRPALFQRACGYIRPVRLHGRAQPEALTGSTG